MSTIRKDHATVAQSGNLRGLLDYPRRKAAPVTRANVMPLLEGRGHLTVFYADGAIGSQSFESFTVALGWVRARRSWRLSEQAPDPLGKVWFNAA